MEEVIVKGIGFLLIALAFYLALNKELFMG